MGMGLLQALLHTGRGYLQVGLFGLTGQIFTLMHINYQVRGDTNLGGETLSVRENEILQLLAKGLLYKEIAIKLSISTGTVR